MPRRRTGGPAFTVEFPQALPAERDGDAWWITVDGREVRLSNLDKVFWPDEGYTKGDLVAYYYNVADLILPYLAGRPLTMKRMPNGISGNFFYEKNAPSTTPDWMRRCPVESEDARNRVIKYLLVDDTAGLLFMANLGCIEFHPLHSRCDNYEHPNYAFFDLDPFDVDFDDVLAVATHVRAALDVLGLRAYAKTSGATGVQVYVPIEDRFTHDEVREFVRLIGTMIRKADPGRVTMQWEVRTRSGKVFIDHNMNRSGANIAAVYSTRPEPGATVSTPVTWDEVAAGVRPGDFTIQTIWKRLGEVGDLFRPVISEPQDLTPAMAALGVDVSKAPPMPGVIQGARGRSSSRGPHGEEQPTSGSPDRKGGRDRSRAMQETSEEVIARSKDPKLGEYLKKRDLSATPEPGPGAEAGEGNSFVIQKHRATRLHYDLRLERDGVLVSWAVPKGLPTQRGVRHLAIQTEDHPLEYATFEGNIPKGHYGAGEVVIWDRGRYGLVEWTDKKVSFRLFGSRYDGTEYHLVKTAQGWLVFMASASEELAAGTSPPSYLPMLAEGGYEPFEDQRWRFEPKFDGVRTLVYVQGEGVRLVSRKGRDQSAQYPELLNLWQWITATTAVLDGEIVAIDEGGRTSFERLQSRINLQAAGDIERMRRQVPVDLALFDVLYLDGEEIIGLPLEERRERLERIVVADSPARMQLTYAVDGDGVSFTASAKALGFEGVVAKRLGSAYHPGRRTGDWRKIKILNRQDCVVIGWTPGEGRRTDVFGALLLGAYDDGRLRWIGQVGTGFTDRMLTDLMGQLRPLQRNDPPIPDPELRKVKGAVFVEPQLVCEVEYLEMTSAGKLRAPSYKGLRLDKAAEDCILERPAAPKRARRVRTRP
jgi:bifunctional non-homologous end joining protein LigD